MGGRGMRRALATLGLAAYMLSSVVDRESCMMKPCTWHASKLTAMYEGRRDSQRAELRRAIQWPQQLGEEIEYMQSVVERVSIVCSRACWMMKSQVPTSSQQTSQPGEGRWRRRWKRCTGQQ